MRSIVLCRILYIDIGLFGERIDKEQDFESQFEMKEYMLFVRLQHVIR